MKMGGSEDDRMIEEKRNRSVLTEERKRIV